MDGTLKRFNRPRRFALVLALLGIGLQIGCAARAPVAPPLNSERIEQRFGSYGVQVLYQDASLRVSNLYSREQGRRVCRTLALVEFAPRIAPPLTREHRLIVDGQSLGAVFKANGWEIEKRTRYLGEVALKPGYAYLRELMGDTGAATLAVHVYDFSVRRGGAFFDYARITEVHHPDYLRLVELRTMASDQGAELGAEVEAALERAGRRLSGLSYPPSPLSATPRAAR